MRKMIFILPVALLVFLQGIHCDPPDPFSNPDFPSVRLSTSVNDTSETIHLGDTLKFRLVVPDTIYLVSGARGDSTVTPVRSLEKCYWLFHFYSMDTTGIAPYHVSRITDISSAFVTEGAYVYNEVRTSTGAKPYRATLNIVPKSRGLFYVDFGTQETMIKLNNSVSAGLRVNMNVVNKHWYLEQPYFPGAVGQLPFFDNLGYGNYVFRVN